MSEDNQIKHLQHLEESALPAPKELPKLTAQKAEEAPDLFLWCVNDITLKLQNIGAVIPDDFRLKLYRNIFVSTLDLSLDQLENSHPDVAKKINKFNKLEDVLEYLSTLIESDIELGITINKSLIAAYVSKCMEFEVTADPFVSSFLYQ